ncbi:MAG TPA: hypothetical protein VGC42_27905, partial [Kofleriaceae bacterium]
NPMDGRADLYAAAVLGYEMLCGQPPFYSDDKLEVMSMHTARPVPPMRQRMVRGGRPVPSSIERLIARGLTKKPSDRYPSADEFLAEVERALRTPDGGVTDVVFERPGDTGAQPLVSDDGDVRLTGGSELADGSDAIADAISDALSTPAAPVRVVMPGIVNPSTPRGGVGLGLPYTGPAGEPIFGMTPAQRLAGPAVTSSSTRTPDGVAAALEPDPRPPTVIPLVRKRLGLYIVIAACAIAIGVVGAIIYTNLTHDAAPPVPVEPPPKTPAVIAKEALEHGDVQRALAVLEDPANKDAVAGDARSQLVLGHVHAALNQNAAALLAYEKALTLDPTLETDAKMRAALRAMAGGRNDYPIVAQAFDDWVGRTTDPEALKALLVSAVHNDIARRKAVRKVIEDRELTKQVDWLAAYSLDLEQDAPCEARRKAVAHLRALDDVRAVGSLQRAATKVTRTRSRRYPFTGFNACLVNDANAAIAYLNGLPPK